MKIAASGIALVGLLVSGMVFAQAMFRGDAAHDGAYRGDGPRQFHRVKWKFPTGDVVHASPAYADDVAYFGSWDSYFYAVDAKTGAEKWRFHGGEDLVIHNQVGFQSSPAVVNGIVYTGCRDSKLYAIDAVTGRELVKKQGLAYMFSSPSVAGSTVYIGVLNGTLEARDLAAGDLLWEFQTEASKRNAGWVLTADRKFNIPLLFPSNWRENPLIGTIRQSSVGSIFSSPLIVGNIVYFGSADGNLYALE